MREIYVEHISKNKERIRQGIGTEKNPGNQDKVVGDKYFHILVELGEPA